MYLADCQWGQWGEWSECDVKQCTKSRSRTIRRKADGGKPCKEKDAVNSTTCTTPCEDGSKIKSKYFGQQRLFSKLDVGKTIIINYWHEVMKFL